MAYQARKSPLADALGRFVALTLTNRAALAVPNTQYRPDQFLLVDKEENAM